MKNIRLVVLTPVNRYLGFSAPISPVDQFTKAVAKHDGIDVIFKDPQYLYVTMSKDNYPVLMDANGQVEGDVFFPFGHEPLDRNMVKYIVRALEISGYPTINGTKSLTVADDKGLMALEFAGHSEVNTPNSTITSARSDASGIISRAKGNILISKMTGYTAGGVGVQPLTLDVNQVAPALWMSRMDSRPRVLQNDIDGGEDSHPRTVIRAYVVGGKVIGCYATAGYGIVNCAGLARESKAESYIPSEEEVDMLLRAASIVGASGYCRIDAVGKRDTFGIFEVNPLARIDADAYGINVAGEIIKYAKKIAERSNEKQ